MKREKFITATIIMIIGGFFTKILGMLIRIVITRLIGLEGIGMYMMVAPTFNLFIIISQLGVPVAISKLVAEDKKNNKQLIFSILPIIMIFNALMMIIIIICTPILANHLLKNPKLIYPLLSISIVLPFITISNIVRGYFFGKQKIFPHVLSNNMEQIIRMIAIIIFVPILYQRGIEYAVSGVVLVNIASELISIIILIGYLPKKFKVHKSYFKLNKEYLKDIISVGLPTTADKIVSSITRFLEPIILTQVLTAIGYSTNFIVNEYGKLTGYVLPLLLLPSFFAQAISSVLIPVISQNYVKHQMLYIKNKLKQAILLSFAIGLITTTSLMIKPLLFLNFIYNTNEGVTYLRILAPFYLIYYIQLPIASALLAMNRAKEALINTIKSATIRTVILFSCSYLKIGVFGLIIAIIVGIITGLYFDYRSLKRILI